MTHGAAVLLGLALAAPAPERPAPPPGATVRTVPARPRVTAPAPAACTSYRVLAEENDLVAEAEVAGWITAALGKAALLDAASPCFVHVRITAGPLRTGGKEDGFVAHVAASTRRFLKDGKLVTREKGMLLVEPRREAIVPRARAFLEAFVAALAAPAPGGDRAGSDRG